MKDLQAVDQIELARLSELGTNFAALIHEIRQPLSGMRLALNLALKLTQAPEANDVLVDVLSQVIRLSEMVDRTSAFYQCDPLLLEDFDLAPVLERVLRMVEYSLSQQKIQLIVEIQALPKIKASIAGVEQILFNLINNARDSLEERGQGGRLIVWAQPSQEQAVIYIADDGIGILAERREEIFKPFTTSKGKKGTGLGLYLARKLAESFSGRLDLLDAPMLMQVLEPPPITAFALYLPLALASLAKHQQQGEKNQKPR